MLPTSAPITLAVVAADSLVRAGLASLLRGQAGLSVVASFAPDDDLRGLELEADVVVWDVDADFAALGLDEALPVLALVAEDAADFPRANGVLYRTAPAAKLAAALGALAQGLSVLEPDFAERLFTQEETDALSEDLTPRELEVLQHLSEGLSNKAIAKTLDISENTVKFHVAALLAKFGVGSRTEVVVRAIQLGHVSV